MKKFIVLFSILLLFCFSAQALPIDALLNHTLDNKEEGELSFALSARLHSLFPYDDSQIEVLGKVFEKTKLSYAGQYSKENTYSILQLDYADMPLFTQAEFVGNNAVYTANSLWSGTVLQTRETGLMQELLQAQMPNNIELLYDAYLAQEEWKQVIETHKSNATHKKNNAKIKGFDKPAFYADTELSEDEISAYVDFFATALFAGFQNAFVTDSIEFVGKWHIKEFFNNEKQLDGLRLKGNVLFNDEKRSVNLYFHSHQNASKIESKLEIKGKRNQSITLEMGFEQNGVRQYSKFERIDGKESILQEVNSNLKFKDTDNKRIVSGKVVFIDEQQGAEPLQQTITIEPNITVHKIQNNRFITGDAKFAYSKNDAKIINLDLFFDNELQNNEARLALQAMQKADAHGGIDANASFLQSVAGMFAQAEKVQVLNLANYNSAMLEALKNQSMQVFAGRLLKAMLAQPDHSEEILSYGMQKEDWEQFLEYYKNQGE